MSQRMDYYKTMVMSSSSYSRCVPAPRAPLRRDQTWDATAVSGVPPAPHSAHPVSVRRYTHNPYASPSATPSCSSMNTSRHVNSGNTSCDSSMYSCTAPLAPFPLPHPHQQQQQQQQQLLNPPLLHRPPYPAPELDVARKAEAPFAAGGGLEESFGALIGRIADAACTAGGRHLLVAALRLQHRDKTCAIHDELLPRLRAVAVDANGCHVLRALVESLPTDRIAPLAAHLPPETVCDMAVASQHTRRALQSLFEHHRTDALTPVAAALARSGRRLAMTQQGCIAVIRVIEHAMPHQQQPVIAALLPELATLAANCYGNYVVQCILQHVEPAALVPVVCRAFAGHWVSLSRNKYASNVIERVVRQMEGAPRRALIEELVLQTQNLKCLMQDGFGNFVLQAIIDSSTDAEEFRELAGRVRPLLHTSPYGHKIESKLQSGLMRSLRATPAMDREDDATPAE